MSGTKLRCGECVTWQRVTLNGKIYKHGDCPGGGKEPLKEKTSAELLEESMYTVEEVQEFVNPRKTGYTDEQLEHMLSDITPKRQKLRERIAAFFRRSR